MSEQTHPLFVVRDQASGLHKARPDWSLKKRERSFEGKVSECLFSRLHDAIAALARLAAC
jgi:hypothetical protein